MVARRFFVLGHTQTTDPGFSLDDLTGGAGRIDVVARAVTSALLTSHGVRDDTEVWCALPGRPGSAEPPRVVRLRGQHLRSLNPDERSTAALLRKACAGDVVPDGHFEPVHPGIDAALLPPLEALAAFAAQGPLLWLDRDGQDLRTLPPDLLAASAAGAPGWVLSDHHPFAQAEQELLVAHQATRVSAGPLWLHGHHVVALVHDELDRRA